MSQEVGRWACDKCGRIVVAFGPRAAAFKGIGAYMGPCPWDCGAWMNRGFRQVKPGKVQVLRGDEWDSKAGAPQA